MSNLKLVSVCAFALAFVFNTEVAMGCSDLKCPFTGQPPNYECPPKFKAIPGLESTDVTLQITGISAGAQAGESCQVTVFGLSDFLNASQVSVLDYDTRLPLAQFDGFRPDERVAHAFSKGLDTRAQKISGYGTAQIKPQSFSSEVLGEIDAGKTVIVEVTYRTDSRIKGANPEALANMLLGYSSVVTGHLSDASLPDGHTSWKRITELVRDSEAVKKQITE